MQCVMLYCQYLSGMGHLVRTTQFAKALSEKFRPIVIIGGPKIEDFQAPDDVEIVYMPPLWLDNGSFRVADGADVEAVKRARRETLIDLFDAERPEIVITEFFPFGRHDLLFELEPWMKHIKATAPHTLVVSSLRDLIGKTVLDRQTGKIAELANAYFDAVLVHTDPQFLRFEDSFVGAKSIQCPIMHTGFVAEAPRTAPLDTDHPFILVSVGGGRIGGEVLDAALGAADILKDTIPHEFRIFTGPFLPEENYQLLVNKANHLPNVQLARFTSNLLAHMESADLSISLAGYNTTMNVLRAQVPSILVPIGHYDFDCEQLMRAEKLADLGAIDMIRQDDVSAETLAQQITQTLGAGQSQTTFNLDGARDATDALESLVAQRASFAQTCARKEI